MNKVDGVVRNIIGAKKLDPNDLTASALVGPDKKGLDYDNAHEILERKHRNGN